MRQKQNNFPGYSPLFVSAGLSEKEALVYETLLLSGTQSASHVARQSKLKRGITYASLTRLVGVGLVLESKKSGVSVYTPSHPSSVQKLLDAKQKELMSVSKLLAHKLPELSKQYKLSVGKPTVRYFEGEEGIREVFEDVYAPKDEPVLGCVDLEHAQGLVPGYIKSDVVPKRIRNKVRSIPIFADDILARSLGANDLKELRMSARVNKKEYPLPAEIDVYQDKVVMITFRQNECIALVVENEDIATSLKSVFRLAHGRAQKLMQKA